MRPALAFSLRLDAIRFERVRCPCFAGFFAVFVLVGSSRRLLLGHAGALRNAMTDVAHGIEAGHILFLEKINRVTFALRKQSHQHVGPGYLVAPRILDVQDGALHDALKARCRFGVLASSMISVSSS